MGNRYSFRIEDVTCEHCDARLQSALEGLPGAELIEYTRTDRDEAEVVLAAGESVSQETVDQVVRAASAGTTHDYRVKWEQTPA